MNGPLLIAAIYAPSPLNRRWFELQRRFIERTTTVDHRFQLFLNGASLADHPDADVIGSFPSNEGHASALARLLEIFEQQHYGSYLILDSDCFPIATGWHDVLSAQLQRFAKQVAAPVRVENLDLFAHPCAVFFPRTALRSVRLDFSHSAPTTNLLGREVVDVGSAMGNLNGALLPLVRTNAVNLHPVAGAVYHHLFYHHGAGSRAHRFRILEEFHYYDHWYDSTDVAGQQQALLGALFADPEAFIARLVGEREEPLRRYLVSRGDA
jgi:hypothetical protein